MSDHLPLHKPDEFVKINRTLAPVIPIKKINKVTEEETRESLTIIKENKTTLIYSGPIFKPKKHDLL
jgi:hypothetical protein